jgi:hypothetical protein
LRDEMRPEESWACSVVRSTLDLCRLLMSLFCGQNLGNMPVEIPKDKWPGKNNVVTARRRRRRHARAHHPRDKTLPCMQFEAPIPNTPVLGMETAHRPDDWSPGCRCGRG